MWMWLSSRQSTKSVMNTNYSCSLPSVYKKRELLEVTVACVMSEVCTGSKEKERALYPVLQTTTPDTQPADEASHTMVCWWGSWWSMQLDGSLLQLLIAFSQCFQCSQGMIGIYAVGRWLVLNAWLVDEFQGVQFWAHQLSILMVGSYSNWSEVVGLPGVHSFCYWNHKLGFPPDWTLARLEIENVQNNLRQLICTVLRQSGSEAKQACGLSLLCCCFLTAI